MLTSFAFVNTQCSIHKQSSREVDPVSHEVSQSPNNHCRC